ncbi:hypothetical protein CL634_09905 [bacterium]|nr:hypothetical protein [bacterium]|tara:strand:- start:348 stop:665 length:318 start_codon:yes stop_codon:yes gene_type:complete
MANLSKLSSLRLASTWGKVPVATRQRIENIDKTRLRKAGLRSLRSLVLSVMGAVAGVIVISLALNSAETLLSQRGAVAGATYEEAAVYNPVQNISEQLRNGYLSQ